MNSGEYWVMYSCCVDNCTMPKTLSYSFMNPKPSTAEDYDTMCENCGKFPFADSGTGSLIDHTFMLHFSLIFRRAYINFDTG